MRFDERKKVTLRQAVSKISLEPAGGHSAPKGLGPDPLAVGAVALPARTRETNEQDFGPIVSYLASFSSGTCDRNAAHRGGGAYRWAEAARESRKGALHGVRQCRRGEVRRCEGWVGVSSVEAGLFLGRGVV